jgi:hypothetical protein
VWFMPMETRGKAAARCLVGVGAVVPKEEEHSEDSTAVETAGWVEQQTCRWEEEEEEMASRRGGREAAVLRE